MKHENRKMLLELERAAQALINTMALVPSKEMDLVITSVKTAVSTATRIINNTDIEKMQDWARRLLDTTQMRG